MEQGSKTSPWIGDTFFQKSEKYVRAGADLTDLPFWSPGWAAKSDSRESSGCAEPGPGGASQDQRGGERRASPLGAQALTQALTNLKLWASLCGPRAGHKQACPGPGNSGGRAPATPPPPSTLPARAEAGRVTSVPLWLFSVTTLIQHTFPRLPYQIRIFL